MIETDCSAYFIAAYCYFTSSFIRILIYLGFSPEKKRETLRRELILKACSYLDACSARGTADISPADNTALLALTQARRTLLAIHTIERTTPPSTRNAAPFVAEESGLHTKVTSAATSAGVAKRFNSDVERMVRKKSRSTAAASVFCSAASS